MFLPKVSEEKNEGSKEFYKLTLVPNRDAQEYGDIEIVFQYNETLK